MPTHFTDANGEYLGFDGKTHLASGFTYRTDLSLWDTFRTTHPLFTLVAPEVQRDSLQSLLEMGRVNGVFPRWPSGTADAGSMFGSPANFLFSESYLKGIRGFDTARALSLMVSGALQPGPGSAPSRDAVCITYGYCPSDKTNTSVSKTLEYAWADFATATLAGALGQSSLESQFRKRSLAFRLLWDPETRYFRPKDSSGRFVSFSPTVTSYLGFLGRHTDAYAEGSAFQWRFTAPHRASELVRLFGGDQAFVRELEKFLKGATPTHAALYPGGKYWHGNEHDFHSIYLFNEAGRPDLTQKWARWAMKTRYNTSAGGLDGNDDAGALSSWYVLSALGLYPQAGTDRYWLGSPVVSEAELELGDGHRLILLALNQADHNVYVQRVTLNGQALCLPEISHADLVDAKLVFQMGPSPAPGGGFFCLSL